MGSLYGLLLSINNLYLNTHKSPLCLDLIDVLPIPRVIRQDHSILNPTS